MYNSYNFNSIPSPYLARNIRYMAPVPRANFLFGKMPSKVSFSSILNGTSKTLGVINQAIPVFYQIKPIWNNARTMLRVVRGLNSSEVSNTKKKQIKKQTTSQKKEQTNAPKFFV